MYAEHGGIYMPVYGWKCDPFLPLVNCKGQRVERILLWLRMQLELDSSQTWGECWGQECRCGAARFGWRDGLLLGGDTIFAMLGHMKVTS